MKYGINKLLTIIFLVCLAFFLVIVKIDKPRVLILHSYALNYSWVNDINEGLMRVLAGKPYSIKYYYLDTKRHPWPEFKEKAGRMARQMIASWNPSIIVAIDDNAQQLAGRYYVNDPEKVVVFAGVNGTLENYNYNHASNVTGIFERIPYEAIKEVFVQILPKEYKRIVHISDASPTSRFVTEELRRFSWEPFDLFESIECRTFKEWKDAIMRVKGKADVLLITHYHTISRSAKDKSIVPSQEIIQWTEKHAELPDIGCWGFYVEDGGMLAVGVSPYEQGEVAANMVVQIIEKGTPAKDIPTKKTRQYVIYASASKLKQHHIKLPEVYEAFARATDNYFK